MGSHLQRTPTPDPSTTRAAPPPAPPEPKVGDGKATSPLPKTVSEFSAEGAAAARPGGAARAVVLALLLLAFGLRLQGLTEQAIWWDEARNIDVALRPFWQIPVSAELDIQPPLYYWLLHGWSALLGLERGMPWPVTAFLARYLSVAIGVGGVALLFQLTRRVAGARAAGVALLLGAASPFWLAESQEARMYAMGFALLTAAAFCLLAGTPAIAPRGQKRPGAALALFVILSAAALLTHYNAIFILVAWYLWWVGHALWQPARRRSLTVVFVSGLATLVLVLPMAPIALRQIPTYANPNLQVPGVVDYLTANWQAYVGGYAWRHDLPGALGRWWPWALLFVVLLGSLLRWWSRSRGAAGADGARAGWSIARASGTLSFLFVWLWGGLAFYYLAVLDRGAFDVRYSSFVTPALYAGIGAGLAGLGRLGRWGPPVGVGLLLLGLLPGVEADLNDERFYREDTAGLVAWLRQESRPGDLILVDQKYPFGFYWQRYAVDPGETPAGPEPAAARYLFVDINTVAERLTGLAGDARRVFWVVWYESDTDPRGVVPFLLEKHGEMVGSWNFRGYWVRLWELSPPTRFVLADAMAPVRFVWSGGLAATEVSLPAGTPGPDGQIPVVVRWQRRGGTIGRPLKARVALYDPAGARIAQDDRRILNDRHLAPSEWEQGEEALGVYALFAPELAPGVYEIRLLVYDADDLEPLELVDDAGNPAGFEALLGRISVGGPPQAEMEPDMGLMPGFARGPCQRRTGPDSPAIWRSAGFGACAAPRRRQRGARGPEWR